MRSVNSSPSPGGSPTASHHTLAHVEWETAVPARSASPSPLDADDHYALLGGQLQEEEQHAG